MLPSSLIRKVFSTQKALFSQMRTAVSKTFSPMLNSLFSSYIAWSSVFKIGWSAWSLRSTRYDNPFRWMSWGLTNVKSTLVQVIAWCRQAISHYLSQFWPRSMPPYGITRSQWVNLIRYKSGLKLRISFIFCHQNNHKRHHIACPHRQAMGCLLCIQNIISSIFYFCCTSRNVMLLIMV